MHSFLEKHSRDQAIGRCTNLGVFEVELRARELSVKLPGLCFSLLQLELRTRRGFRQLPKLIAPQA